MTPTPAPTSTPTQTQAAFYFTGTWMCRTDPFCRSGSEALYVGEIMRASFTLNRDPSLSDTVRVEAYWNGVRYWGVIWEGPHPTNGRFGVADPALGYPSAPGVAELRVWVGSQYVGSFSGTVIAAPSAALPTATATRTPTPTPTPAPTPTPVTVVSGGGLSCVARRTTASWDLCVTYPSFSSDAFDVVVTPLTDAAARSYFKVRVYSPDYLSHDSSTKYPFYAGQRIRLHYGFDFFVYAPYSRGTYEVELRVDFLRETSVFVSLK
jgi:hypothetical protein